MSSCFLQSLEKRAQDNRPALIRLFDAEVKEEKNRNNKTGIAIIDLVNADSDSDSETELTLVRLFRQATIKEEEEEVTQDYSRGSLASSIRKMVRSNNQPKLSLFLHNVLFYTNDGQREAFVKMLVDDDEQDPDDMIEQVIDRGTLEVRIDRIVKHIIFDIDDATTSHGSAVVKNVGHIMDNRVDNALDNIERALSKSQYKMHPRFNYVSAYLANGFVPSALWRTPDENVMENDFVNYFVVTAAKILVRHMGMAWVDAVDVALAVTENQNLSFVDLDSMDISKAQAIIEGHKKIMNIVKEEPGGSDLVWRSLRLIFERVGSSKKNEFARHFLSRPTDALYRWYVLEGHAGAIGNILPPTADGILFNADMAHRIALQSVLTDDQWAALEWRHKLTPVSVREHAQLVSLLVNNAIDAGNDVEAYLNAMAAVTYDTKSQSKDLEDLVKRVMDTNQRDAKYDTRAKQENVQLAQDAQQNTYAKQESPEPIITIGPAPTKDENKSGWSLSALWNGLSAVQQHFSGSNLNEADLRDLDNRNRQREMDDNESVLGVYSVDGETAYVDAKSRNGQEEEEGNTALAYSMNHFHTSPPVSTFQFSSPDPEIPRSYSYSSPPSSTFAYAQIDLETPPRPAVQLPKLEPLDVETTPRPTARALMARVYPVAPASQPEEVKRRARAILAAVSDNGNLTSPSEFLQQYNQSDFTGTDLESASGSNVDDEMSVSGTILDESELELSYEMPLYEVKAPSPEQLADLPVFYLSQEDLKTKPITRFGNLPDTLSLRRKLLLIDIRWAVLDESIINSEHVKIILALWNKSSINALNGDNELLKEIKDMKLTPPKSLDPSRDTVNKRALEGFSGQDAMSYMSVNVFRFAVAQLNTMMMYNKYAARLVIQVIIRLAAQIEREMELPLTDTKRVQSNDRDAIRYQFELLGIDYRTQKNLDPSSEFTKTYSGYVYIKKSSGQDVIAFMNTQHYNVYKKLDPLEQTAYVAPAGIFIRLLTKFVTPFPGIDDE